MPKRLSLSSFIKRAKGVHGNTYDYSKAIYNGYREELAIICKIHGKFYQTPNIHLAGSGCTTCGRLRIGNKPSPVESFIQKAVNVHGYTYDYSKVSYVNARTTILVICPIHGEFPCIPDNHTSKGSGCPKCAGRTLTPDEIILLFEQTHGLTYDYSKVDFNQPKVEIICKKHGSFYKHRIEHQKGQGCPDCSKLKSKRWSKIAIEWIEKESKTRRLKNVQHALNLGEFQIPGTTLRVDGYHPRSKTVFEFHGDCFHGNPKLFKPSSMPNPYSTKTAKELYLETLEKEDLIHSLGYNVIVVWENDYRAGHRFSYTLE